MRVMILGDCHGNVKDTVAALNEAGRRRISHVFQVGDWGLWTHFADGQEFLDRVQATAEANSLTVFAIGGNHENWDHWNWFVENLPTHKGFAMVRRRVLLAPKAHEFRLANRQFVVAGGAVSIDKVNRLDNERGARDISGNRVRAGTGARTLWWPNEELTDQDVARIEKFPKADILLTHDCSNFSPFNGRIKPDADSERHRRRIDRVIAAVEPKVHFHGHMHSRYEWENAHSHGYSAFMDEPWQGPVTKTYGLEANPEAQRYSIGPDTGDWWGVLDTETLEFAFKGEGMQFRSLEPK